MKITCNYCENHGGAVAHTACPACGQVSLVDEKDRHLEAPCEWCGGAHAIIFCAAYNRHIGMAPLHGYEV